MGDRSHLRLTMRAGEAVASRLAASLYHLFMFSYAVTCRFHRRETAEQWVAWLRDGHIADVLAAGASRAELVMLDHDPQRDDPAGVTCEVRYRFPSRTAFERYEREHAPRLRAEGLERFPPEQMGLTYTRRTGEVLLRRKSEPVPGPDRAD